MSNFNKSLFVIFLISINSLISPVLSQDNLSGRWKCDLTINEYSMGPFTMYLEFFSENDTSFYAHSTKNADKRITGSFKAILGRVLKKSPKKGIFISIKDGKIVRFSNNDSLFGKIALPMIGALDFAGSFKNNELNGILTDNTKKIATINGIKVKLNDKMDFTNLVNNITDTTKAYIFNPVLLETKKWRKFNKKLNKISINALDDIELFFGFNMLSPKLPFSHYNLFIFDKSSDEIINESTTISKNIYLEGKNDYIYMNIKSFGGNAAEMDSIFNIILSKNQKNLIVDLRENSGGGLDSAIPFGEYIVDSALYAGSFLTHKWFKQYKKVTSPDDFASLPITHSRKTTDFINELKGSSGRRLVLYPGKKQFQGKIFILTSKTTASTCEPIVYALKKKGLATIVGENTAGAMLSASIITAISKYKLYLPIADFYTFDGKRLDQVGVRPNIEISSANALDYVLDNLIK